MSTVAVLSKQALEREARALGFVKKTGAKHDRLVHPDLPSPAFQIVVPRTDESSRLAKQTKQLAKARDLLGVEKPHKNGQTPDVEPITVPAPSEIPGADLTGIPPKLQRGGATMAMIKQWPVNTVEEFTQHYQNFPMREVADLLGISTASVGALVKKFNVPRKDITKSVGAKARKSADGLRSKRQAAAAVTTNIDTKELADLMDYDRMAHAFVRHTREAIMESIWTPGTLEKISTAVFERLKSELPALLVDAIDNRELEKVLAYRKR